MSRWVQPALVERAAILAAMNRFAPFPDLGAACSIRPRPFGMSAPLHSLAFNVLSPQL